MAIERAASRRVGVASGVGWQRAKIGTDIALTIKNLSRLHTLGLQWEKTTKEMSVS